MAKRPDLPNRKISTSAEPLEEMTSAGALGQDKIGTRVTVLGRDVTIGQHKAPPIQHSGKVEALHINRERVRVILVREGLQFNQTRVIEVTA